MEIDPQDVLDLLRELRDEPDPCVRVGLYYAAVILGIVVEDPAD